LVQPGQHLIRLGRLPLFFQACGEISRNGA
jgi:hypothetical protein